MQLGRIKKVLGTHGSLNRENMMMMMFHAHLSITKLKNM
jgi:hypothetical protein